MTTDERPIDGAAPRFDVADIFDDDYLYFYAGFLTDERSDADAELIWRLLDIAPGLRVLDLACGHGRIANRLAARGASVTGLDATERFLEVARSDAAARGVHVDYHHGDMRDLPWSGAFDRIVNWFTAYGYFTDADNRRVLVEAAKALKPGGRLLIEVNNRDWIVANFLPMHGVELGDDLMVDQSEYDPLSSRITTRRTVVRGGTVRKAEFFVRLFAFTELRDWLLAAGFRHVDGFGEDGTPLSRTSRRMTVVAHR